MESFSTWGPPKLVVWAIPSALSNQIKILYILVWIEPWKGKIQEDKVMVSFMESDVYERPRRPLWASRSQLRNLFPKRPSQVKLFLGDFSSPNLKLFSTKTLYLHIIYYGVKIYFTYWNGLPHYITLVINEEWLSKTHN